MITPINKSRQAVSFVHRDSAPNQSSSLLSAMMYTQQSGYYLGERPKQIVIAQLCVLMGLIPFLNYFFYGKIIGAVSLYLAAPSQQNKSIITVRLLCHLLVNSLTSFLGFIAMTLSKNHSRLIRMRWLQCYTAKVSDEKTVNTTQKDMSKATASSLSKDLQSIPKFSSNVLMNVYSICGLTLQTLVSVSSCVSILFGYDLKLMVAFTLLTVTPLINYGIQIIAKRYVNKASQTRTSSENQLSAAFRDLANSQTINQSEVSDTVKDNYTANADSSIRTGIVSSIYKLTKTASLSISLFLLCPTTFLLRQTVSDIKTILTIANTLSSVFSDGIPLFKLFNPLTSVEAGYDALLKFNHRKEHPQPITEKALTIYQPMMISRYEKKLLATFGCSIVSFVISFGMVFTYQCLIALGLLTGSSSMLQPLLLAAHTYSPFLITGLLASVIIMGSVKLTRTFNIKFQWVLALNSVIDQCNQGLSRSLSKTKQLLSTWLPDVCSKPTFNSALAQTFTFSLTNHEQGACNQHVYFACLSSFFFCLLSLSLSPSLMQSILVAPSFGSWLMFVFAFQVASQIFNQLSFTSAFLPTENQLVKAYQHEPIQARQFQASSIKESRFHEQFQPQEYEEALHLSYTSAHPAKSLHG